MKPECKLALLLKSWFVLTPACEKPLRELFSGQPHPLQGREGLSLQVGCCLGNTEQVGARRSTEHPAG